MKAIAYTEYGPPDVLQLQEVEAPTPKDNEVLIKVHATAVTFGECKARDFTFSPREFWLPLPLWPLARLDFGWSKPRRSILGSELSGEIESVGKEVVSFKPGDKVTFQEMKGAKKHPGIVMDIIPSEKGYKSLASVYLWDLGQWRLAPWTKEDKKLWKTRGEEHSKEFRKNFAHLFEHPILKHRENEVPQEKHFKWKGVKDAKEAKH